MSLKFVDDALTPETPGRITLAYWRSTDQHRRYGVVLPDDVPELSLAPDLPVLPEFSMLLEPWRWLSAPLPD